MTRHEAMFKLLAVGEMRLVDLYEVCGWQFEEVRSVLAALTQAGRITYLQVGGERWYRSGEAAGASEAGR